jgi:hypothetical protein
MPLESMKVLDIVSMVQPGDILAFSGQGNIVSDLVRSATGSIVSHVGIVLNSQSSIDGKPVQPKIIESTSLGGFQGVTVTDLIMRATYYPGFIWYLPLRLDLQKKIDPKKLEYWLLQQKGKQYDTWGAIESALLQWEQSEYWKKIASVSTELEKEGMNYWRKITSLYSPQTSTPVAPTVENAKPIANWFCSELAGAALQQVGVLPSTLDPDFIRPTDLVAMQIYSGTYYQIKGTLLTVIPEYNSKPISGVSVAFGGIDTESIFQKALRSNKTKPIIAVSDAFEEMGESHKAKMLYKHIYANAISFGAMARGIPVPNTNGAVVPPGRYWIDVIGDAKRKAWIYWSVSKPEVTIEKSEYSADNLKDPNQVMMTVIFSIPPTANNFGHPGVFFPTQVLGFPTIAGPANSPYSVQSKPDTVQRPAPMTYMEASKEVITKVPKGLSHSVEYIADTAGKAIGSAVKGAGEGLGISTTNVILIGVATLASLFLLARMSSPLAIASHLAK